jgi:hypothetical protein
MINILKEEVEELYIEQDENNDELKSLYEKKSKRI